MRRLELAGRRFGRWRVIGFAGIRNGHSYWECLCECGRAFDVQGSSLTGGNSDFCIVCSAAGRNHQTHGMRHSAEYRIWLAMKNRCFNRRSQDWRYYGGRGIRVCRRWRRSFAAFYADMGKRPRGKSIDRRNNDGNYTPRNCRWASARTQSRNRKARQC